MSPAKEGSIVKELIVVREVKSNAQVARETWEAIQSNPHEHQVDVLAEKLGVPADQIAHILNNYGPDGNGGVEQRPEGQGGGWLPEEIAQQYRTVREASQDAHIGFRWPDGSLRDEAFDPTNANHWEAAGIEMPERLRQADEG